MCLQKIRNLIDDPIHILIIVAGESEMWCFVSAINVL